MTIKIATCLLALSLFSACQTTTKSADSRPARSRQTLQQRMLAQNSANPNSVQETAPPAEGPEDVPAEGPIDPTRNPGLLPTPLLRSNAASGL
jgi:hypothetical protein